jgi:hypothetical protein
MHQIQHSNSIKQSSVRSNQTHKNIKILKKFGLRELMFNLVQVKKHFVNHINK